MAAPERNHLGGVGRHSDPTGAGEGWLERRRGDETEERTVFLIFPVVSREVSVRAVSGVVLRPTASWQDRCDGHTLSQ